MSAQVCGYLLGLGEPTSGRAPKEKWVFLLQQLATANSGSARNQPLKNLQPVLEGRLAWSGGSCVGDHRYYKLVCAQPGHALTAIHSTYRGNCGWRTEYNGWNQRKINFNSIKSVSNTAGECVSLLQKVSIKLRCGIWRWCFAYLGGSGVDVLIMSLVSLAVPPRDDTARTYNSSPESSSPQTSILPARWPRSSRILKVQFRCALGVPSTVFCYSKSETIIHPGNKLKYEGHMRVSHQLNRKSHQTRNRERYLNSINNFTHTYRTYFRLKCWLRSLREWWGCLLLLYFKYWKWGTGSILRDGKKMTDIQLGKKGITHSYTLTHSYSHTKTHMQTYTYYNAKIHSIQL